MAIKADIIKTDIILTLTDQSTTAGFLGYEIERSREGSAWLAWTGSAWVEGGVSALSARNRFTDYEVSDGIYQYRARARFGVDPDYTFSEYEETEFLRISTSNSGVKTGWSFENYTPPEGEFGEILTADDMRYTYLWGVPFTSSQGLEYTDPQIRFKVDSAVRELEVALCLTIKKRRIGCQQEPDDGIEYDEMEDAYAYHRHHWNAGGRINLRRRPVLSIESFDLYTITGTKIMDLKGWVRLDHSKGNLFFYPQSGPQGTMRVSPTFLSYRYLAPVDYPQGYRVKYTAGFADAGKVYPELRDIIGKITACKLLNIIGDGLISGFASSSLSLDGISESISTTQSATNAYYGARIGVYLKDIKEFIEKNRMKYRSISLGSV